MKWVGSIERCIMSKMRWIENSIVRVVWWIEWEWRVVSSASYIVRVWWVAWGEKRIKSVELYVGSNENELRVVNSELWVVNTENDEWHISLQYNWHEKEADKGSAAVLGGSYEGWGTALCLNKYLAHFCRQPFGLTWARPSTPVACPLSPLPTSCAIYTPQQNPLPPLSSTQPNPVGQQWQPKRQAQKCRKFTWCQK